MFHRRCSYVVSVILFYFVEQGPDVQGIVGLTNSLIAQLVKYVTTLWPNALKFLVEKVRKAFAASHSFSTENIGILEKLTSENLTKRWLTTSLVLSGRALVAKWRFFTPYTLSIRHCLPAQKEGTGRAG